MALSFSVYGQGDLSNYCDFSVDLSRVLPENLNKRKNYSEYKAEKTKSNNWLILKNICIILNITWMNKGDQ